MFFVPVKDKKMSSNTDEILAKLSAQLDAAISEMEEERRGTVKPSKPKPVRSKKSTSTRNNDIDNWELDQLAAAIAASEQDISKPKDIKGDIQSPFEVDWESQQIAAAIAESNRSAAVDLFKQQSKSKCGAVPGWVDMRSLSDDWKHIFPDHITCLCYRDCGGGGDCMFHSISYALTSPDAPLTANQIRTLASYEVTPNIDLLYGIIHDANERKRSNIITKTARRLKIAPEQLRTKLDALGLQNDASPSIQLSFSVRWDDPQVKEVFRTLATDIATPGNTYWGDISTLKLLQKSEQMNDVGYLILRSPVPIINLLVTDDTKILIILINIDDVHWNLGGVACDGKMQVLFDVNRLPPTVALLYNALGRGAHLNEQRVLRTLNSAAEDVCECEVETRLRPEMTNRPSNWVKNPDVRLLPPSTVLKKLTLT